MTASPGDFAVELARRGVTPRERTVLIGVAYRLSNGEIASALSISKRTVESYVASLFMKLGASSRAELIEIAIALLTATEGESPASGAVDWLRRDADVFERALPGLNRRSPHDLLSLAADPDAAAAVRQAHEEVAAIQRVMHDQLLLAQASGVLLERHLLPDAAAAVRGLLATARDHAVDARVLARAVVTARTTRGRPGPPPQLGFVDGDSSGLGRDAVLTAALDAAVAATAGSHGALLLTSPGRRGLDIERTVGFSAHFFERFKHLEDGAAASVMAVRSRRPFSVPDIMRDATYHPDFREALIAEGARAVHSTPMLTRQGVCRGAIVVHQSVADRTLTPVQSGMLQQVAGCTAEWLEWHQDSRLAEALDDLAVRLRRDKQAAE